VDFIGHEKSGKNTIACTKAGKVVENGNSLELITKLHRLFVVSSVK